MARFYADEQFPFPIVQLLRTLGHDVLTVQEAGKADQGIADDEVLEFATSQKRSILTINRHDFRTYATGTQGFWYKSQGSRVKNQGFLDF
ncbi:DUF5615 family PIN-like protein [aff. Roholtiella sp. LEGE 12411]|uniref:DUF5615 family PIN-like protein n=1 Tax=aff. Roholtiella sp. LEGE 12411 TaxID=1828822 RepID=UPI00187E1CB0|nr:DUF5615 family PIN-like protein [aff. Roholtiella sp. LEGE 12411]